MSQTIYGGPNDDWVSRTTELREVDGHLVSVVEVVMKGRLEVVTFASPRIEAEVQAKPERETLPSQARAASAHEHRSQRQGRRRGPA